MNADNLISLEQMLEWNRDVSTTRDIHSKRKRSVIAFVLMSISCSCFVWITNCHDLLSQFRRQLFLLNLERQCQESSLVFDISKGTNAPGTT